jgi:hypothetical protein
MNRRLILLVTCAGLMALGPGPQEAGTLAAPVYLRLNQVGHRPAESRWKPAVNTSWQVQFSGLPVDQSIRVVMFDIDLFDNDASVVASLHAQGRKVVCYMNAGAWENWRPDADQFPSSVKGRWLSGWPGERWLDIRQLSVLGPIMEARMDLCKARGFDGIDPDNVDGYTNNTGFPLTYQDQLTYNLFLANAAHARGLSIGLKNDLDQVNDLLPAYDWALNEQCFEYNECNTLLPFVDAGKAVFNIEYNLKTSQFCPQANAMRFNSMRKHLSLDAYREPCAVAGDFNDDGRANLADVQIMAGAWHTPNSSYDLDGDGWVTVVDIQLETTLW